MPQFAVLIWSDDSAHEPDTPAPEVHTAHADELAASGAMTYAFALTPREHARTVRRGGVTEGPFTETGECIAGFYLLDVPTIEDALAIAARNPVVAGGGACEVRPVHGGGPVGSALGV